LAASIVEQCRLAIETASHVYQLGYERAEVSTPVSGDSARRHLADQYEHAFKNEV